MNRIYFLFVLFLLLQYSAGLRAQEIQNNSEDLLSNWKYYLHPSNEIPDKENLFYLDDKLDKHSSQADGNYLLETLKREIWNESSSSWTNDSLYDYSYNDIDLVDTIIAHKWRNGSVWGNDLRTTYVYNPSGKLDLESYAQWSLTGWYDNARYEYSYNGPNQNLSRIDFYYYLNIWFLDAYYEYSYNANSYLATVIQYLSSTIFPNHYDPAWKDEYYYDTSNVLIIKTGFNHYNLPDWLPENNDLFFYDNNGNRNENIRQVWNNTDSIWINDYRYLYGYDPNNILISTLYQDWQTDSSNWVNVWKETYTYTPQNKLITMFKETWSQGVGWQDYVLRTYYYDNNDNWTEKLTQLWDGSDWKNYYRHLATWLEPVSVEEEQVILNSYYLYNNFPNPFNPSTKIKFKIPDQARNDNTMVSLKVYDILGKEITILVNEEKPAGEYEVEFSGMNLPTGIYFYTLRVGNPSANSGQVFSETKKMILLK